jgi:hypothetical protein
VRTQCARPSQPVNKAQRSPLDEALQGEHTAAADAIVASARYRADQEPSVGPEPDASAAAATSPEATELSADD